MRLSGLIAFATLVTMLVEHGATEGATIAGFLIATLVAYLAWPAIGTRLPAIRGP